MQVLRKYAAVTVCIHLSRCCFFSIFNLKLLQGIFLRRAFRYLKQETTRQKYSEVLYLTISLGCAGALSSGAVCFFGSPWLVLLKPLLPPSLSWCSSLCECAVNQLRGLVQIKKTNCIFRLQAVLLQADIKCLLMAFTYRGDIFSSIRLPALVRKPMCYLWLQHQTLSTYS